MKRESNRKKLLVAVCTLAGGAIGAGILGLPHVFAKSGYLIGLFWIILLGAILIYAKLCFGEVTLRTKERHQLQGYAEKYLGKWGGRVAYFAMVFGIYSALLAYLIGEGQSLSMLFTGSLKYAIVFGIGFWIAMTLLLREGLKGLKKVESWGFLIISLIILGIFLWFLPDASFEKLSHMNYAMFFLPFGVTLFALKAFATIPELKLELKGHEKLLKKAIILGVLAPMILYALFSFAFVGVYGQNIEEVATLSSNKIVIILGIFTMLTSYFVLSFAMKEMLIFDLHEGKSRRFFYVSLVPLILYLAVSFISVLENIGFVTVISIGGVVSGGLSGILAVAMNIRAKKLGDRKPEYTMPVNWIVIGLISLLFIVGVITDLFF